MRKELAVWRSPNGGSRSVPIGSRSRRESPTGYSSAGCSPAEPASASPVTTMVAQSRSGQAINGNPPDHAPRKFGHMA